LQRALFVSASLYSQKDFSRCSKWQRMDHPCLQLIAPGHFFRLKQRQIERLNYFCKNQYGNCAERVLSCGCDAEWLELPFEESEYSFSSETLGATGGVATGAGGVLIKLATFGGDVVGAGLMVTAGATTAAAGADTVAAGVAGRSATAAVGIGDVGTPTLSRCVNQPISGCHCSISSRTE
jgi:hypothetical protein